MSVGWFVSFLIINAVVAQENLANQRCNHYPDRGTCENDFQVRWYYDRFNHRCREFFYGGCDGNDNRFDTKEECSRTCQPLPTAEDASQRCFLPFDAGQGSGDFERWYFDAQQGRCLCVSWTGCCGNSNLFYSYVHCMKICGAFAKGNGQVLHRLPFERIPVDAERSRQASAPARTNGHGFAPQVVGQHQWEAQRPNYPQLVTERPNHYQLATQPPYYLQRVTERPNHYQLATQPPNYHQLETQQPNYHQPATRPPNYPERVTEPPNHYHLETQPPNYHQLETQRPNYYPSEGQASSRPIDQLPIQSQPDSDISRSAYPFKQGIRFIHPEPEPVTLRPVVRQNEVIEPSEDEQQNAGNDFTYEIHGEDYYDQNE